MGAQGHTGGMGAQGHAGGMGMGAQGHAGGLMGARGHSGGMRALGREACVQALGHAGCVRAQGHVAPGHAHGRAHAWPCAVLHMATNLAVSEAWRAHVRAHGLHAGRPVRVKARAKACMWPVHEHAGRPVWDKTRAKACSWHDQGAYMARTCAVVLEGALRGGLTCDPAASPYDVAYATSFIF